MLRHFLVLAAASILVSAPASAQVRAPQSEELLLGFGAQSLHGTLLLPAQARGAPVLILAGSGPTDRDGNSPGPVRPASYRLLAEGLAAEGIPTLRVDKRGIGASAGAAGPEADIRIGTYGDDARAWAARLRERTGARCVWLLGHSEGVLHALLAAQAPDGICGLILVAGPGRPVGAALREQLRAALEGSPLLDPALAFTDALEAGRQVPEASVPAPLMSLFRPSVQPFMISMLQLNPAALLRDYHGPVLVVQGTTDIQTALADAERLRDARTGVELALIDGMNHVLKTAPADRAANLATYVDPSLPLAPGLVDRIAAFVRAR